MNLRVETKRLLRHYDFFPKKRLGQNFLIDSAVLEELISYASISKQDIVLEIGAGLGFLTELLSRKCKKVITVEIDTKLAKALGERLGDLDNVNLIEGDLLKVSVPPFDKVVSTPPYHISSPLLFWLLERKFDCAVLTFQKEFAERLVASVGSREYGRLTVNAYYRAEVELLRPISRTAFYPQPEVDSSIIRVNPRAEPPFSVDDDEIFFRLVRILFTQRNKKVRNAITPFLQTWGFRGKDAKKLADALPFHNKRVRKLAPEDFGCLANILIREIIAAPQT